MAPGLSEERKTGLHWLFCTGPGVIRLKKFFAGACGVAIIITSILIIIGSFLDFTKWIGLIRYCWNCLFGFQMVLMQFKMEKWLFRHFGFLKGWFGKALFFLFVGSNIMNQEYWSSYIVGGCCIFVGLVELAIGCKCADDEEGKDDQMTDEQSQAGAGIREPIGHVVLRAHLLGECRRRQRQRERLASPRRRAVCQLARQRGRRRRAEQ